MTSAVKISRREGPVLALGLLVLALLLILIRVQLGTLQAARAEAAGESQDLSQAELWVKQLRGVAANRAMAGAQKAALERTLPPEPYEDELLDYLQDQADRAAVRLVKVQFDAVVAKTGYVEIPMIITTEQHFAGLCTLLDELQSGERALRIDKIKVGQVKVRDMGEGTGQADPGLTRTEITAAAFYQAAPGNAGNERGGAQ